jgi:DNA-binding SARP family transcriptional activator
VQYLLRLLAHDPHDEPAHLRLVSVLRAGGRHGEARRCYRRYTDRMAELDIDPAPFPPATCQPGERQA